MVRKIKVIKFTGESSNDKTSEEQLNDILSSRPEGEFVHVQWFQSYGQASSAYTDVQRNATRLTAVVSYNEEETSSD